MLGQVKIFQVGSHQFREWLRELLRERVAQVVGCHAENGISNSESCSENTPELSESSANGLFTPRAFFLKLGGPQASEVSLWKNGLDSLSKQVGVLKGATKSRDFCDSDREMLLRRPEPCEP